MSAKLASALLLIGYCGALQASTLPFNISIAIGNPADALFTSADYAQATDWGVLVIETANEQVFVYLFGDGAVSTIKDGGWQQVDYGGYVPPVEPVPVETPEPKEIAVVAVGAWIMFVALVINRWEKQR